MPTNKNELTQEMMMKAMQCKDADELIALAKAEGKEITKEDAEACLDKMGDFELDDLIYTKKNRLLVQAVLSVGAIIFFKKIVRIFRLAHIYG